MSKDDVLNKTEVIRALEVISNGHKELASYMEKLEGKKNYSELPEMNSNPFICLLNDEFEFKSVKVGRSGTVTSVLSDYVNTDTGEVSKVSAVSGGKVFYDKRYVDSNTFTKLYKKNMKEMFSLSSTALKLFGYFIEQIDFKDKDGMIYMDLQEGMDFCEYGENSRSLIYRGLVELVQKGFICKTNRPWTFFVNPKYVHNGDRIAIFKEYISKPSDNDVSIKEIETW